VTISVVQSKAFNAAWSGSLTSNVTAGNTVFLFAYQYTNSGASMSSSSPLFGGNAVSGATQPIPDFQASGAATVSCTVWMLPNLGGGAASVALTNVGGIVDTNVGLAAAEVSGLGATPALDTASPNPATATGSAGNPASGSTGAIVSSPDIILGIAVEYGTALTAPGGAWSAPTGGQAASGCLAGWQVVTSSGGTYAYSATGSGQRWDCGAVAVAVTASGPSAPQQPAILYVMRRV
jgi:hypothetical protein